MKKYFFAAAIFLMCFCSYVFSTDICRDYEYTLSLYGNSIATESASMMKNASTDEISIESITILNSEDEKATYRVKGLAADSKILEYSLNIEFNGKNANIKVSLNEGLYTAAYGDKLLETSDEFVVIVDNNISWPWQLFFDYHEKTGANIYSALIPQLIAYGEEITIPLEITKKTVFDGETNLFIKLGSNTGLIKADTDGIVRTVLIGVAKSELK